MATYDSVRALLNQGGVARPTLYRVIVPSSKVGGAVNDHLELLCKSASIPETSANTVTALGQDAQGVTRESPSNVIFGKPFSITVISDTNYTVYKGMRRWFDTVCTNANPAGGGGTAAQKASYYSDITAAITIIKEEQRQRQPFTVTLNNAYPVRMGEIGLQSDAYDTALEFAIDFYYETLTFTGT